jgi:hypothetical protein
MTTLWSGRFADAPDPTALEWGSSFSFDRRLFEDDVRGSSAWAKALTRAGVLGDEEGQAIDGRSRRSSNRARPIRRSSSARTRTFTALSNVSSWSGSGMPGAACIRAVAQRAGVARSPPLSATAHSALQQALVALVARARDQAAAAAMR